MEELIMDIPGYEGRYKATTAGTIISVRGMRPLKPYKGKSNYYKVGLVKDGKTYYERVHRLVAETFIPNEEDKPQVDHIDGNSTNNNADNLRWATPRENMNNPNTRAKMAATLARMDVRERMSEAHSLVEERKRLFRLGDTGYTSTGRVIS